MALAVSTGLAHLANRWLTVRYFGANAGLKITALIAGMLAGADSIDEIELLLPAEHAQTRQTHRPAMRRAMATATIPVTAAGAVTHWKE